MRPLDAFASQDRLLLSLGRQLDESMIDDIARADYGEDFEEHKAVILRMCGEAYVPPPGWVPQEVLELVRWSQPEVPEWRPGGHGLRGHRMRAFCCAAQLRIIGEARHDGGDSIAATLGNLLLSLDVIPLPDWDYCQQFLQWFGRCLGDMDGYDTPFAEEPALVLLGQIFAAASHGEGHSDLPELLDAYLAADARRMTTSTNDGWPIPEFSLAAQSWPEIGRRLATRSDGVKSAPHKEMLALIGLTLLPHE